MTVSNLTVDTENGMVVPKVHHHLALEGVNTSADRRVRYRAYDVTLVGTYEPSVWSAGMIDIETGFYLEMSRVASTSFYSDVVNDDGEIKR